MQSRGCTATVALYNNYCEEKKIGPGDTNFWCLLCIPPHNKAFTNAYAITLPVAGTLSLHVCFLHIL